MTASKLEESIERIAGVIYSHFLDGRNKKVLAEALRAFAEAMREPQFDPAFAEKMQDFKWCGYDQKAMRSMRDCAISAGWKPPESAKQMTLEQAAKITLGNTKPEECPQPHVFSKSCALCFSPTDLPDEVEEKIRRIIRSIHGECGSPEFMKQCDYYQKLNDLACLCLSVAGRGRG